MKAVFKFPIPEHCGRCILRGVTFEDGTYFYCMINNHEIDGGRIMFERPDFCELEVEE